METLTHAVQNASTAASNAIWGEQQPQSQRTEQIVAARHGEEPLSGVQGKGTAADPYDAGNKDGEYIISTTLTIPIEW
jgi:hypothetical protein